MVYVRHVTHFYHKNITKGVTSWLDYSMIRDFKTVEEMTDAMVEGINKYVKEDDILIHLGDWSFGGVDKIWTARNRINCKNIYLVAGNHDLKILQNKTLPNCYGNDKEIVDGKPDEYNCVMAQDLFKNNIINMSLLIQIDKKLVYLSHFPVDNVRFDMPHYHLHGHMHGISNVSDYALKKDRLDIGIDSAFSIYGEYKPFSWGEICKLLK